MRYDDLTRKQKQLIASEYPYKSDTQLWNTSKNGKKFFTSRDEILDFKEQAAQDDVSLTNRRDFVTGKEQEKQRAPTISIVDTILGDMGEEPYRAALELAKNEFDPLFIVKDLFAIQATRLRKGIEYENEVGLGVNAETEACMSNLVNIVKVGNDIVNAKKLDIKVEGSLSNMILDMNLDDINMDDFDDDFIDASVIDAEDMEFDEDDG